jgi:hypothetical protein
VDFATPLTQVTALGMAEGMVTVEATAGAAVFGEVSVRALAGVGDTAEASDGGPSIRLGMPAMARRTDPRTAIPMG